MYSAEVLSQLRSLNWLGQELRRVPEGSGERAYLQTQVEAVRERLPSSILDHHDRLSEDGKPSAEVVTGNACGSCRAPLPDALLAELNIPGRFGLCPACGHFLWIGEAHPAATTTPRPSH